MPGLAARRPRHRLLVALLGSKLWRTPRAAFPAETPCGEDFHERFRAALWSLWRAHEDGETGSFSGVDEGEETVPLAGYKHMLLGKLHMGVSRDMGFEEGCWEAVAAALMLEAVSYELALAPLACDPPDVTRPGRSLARSYDEIAGRTVAALQATRAFEPGWPLEELQELLAAARAAAAELAETCSAGFAVSEHPRHFFLQRPELAALAAALGPVHLPVVPSIVGLAWERQSAANPLAGPQVPAMQIQLSEEQAEISFRNVVGALKDAGAEFLPITGTLIGLLRYGALIGRLPSGHADVVELDMDWLVRVAAESAPPTGSALRPWPALAAAISAAMLRHGWSECFLAAGDGGAGAGEPFSRRVLVCNVLKPFFHTASFAPLRIDEDQGVAYTARSCPSDWPRTSGGGAAAAAAMESKLRGAGFRRALEDGCWYEPAEDWAERWGGRVPAYLIYPLSQCSGYGHPVPCPHEPVKLAQGSGEHGPRCMAAPLITGDRNPYDERNQALLKDGLSPADVLYLKERAAMLAAEGYASFYGTFDECSYSHWRQLKGNLDKWELMQFPGQPV